jgi:hypothetical protein
VVTENPSLVYVFTILCLRSMIRVHTVNGLRNGIRYCDGSVVRPERVGTRRVVTCVGSRGTCFNGFVPTSATTASYLICATPRTGSTLLCG